MVVCPEMVDQKSDANDHIRCGGVVAIDRVG